MKKIFCLFVAMALLSGCALTTIRPPKKGTDREAEPARSAKKSVVEKVREAIRPQAKPVIVEEKEEVLVIRKGKKEEVLIEDEELIK